MSTTVPGQVFSPYGQFNCLHIPVSLSPELSDFAQLLYGRLAMYEGDPKRSGGAKCFAGVAELARTTGRSESKVERALRELTRHGLIKRVRQKQERAVTKFVYHAMLDGSLKVKNRPSQDPSDLTGQEIQDPANVIPKSVRFDGQDPSDLTGALKEEKIQPKDSKKHKPLAIATEASFSFDQTQLQNLSTELHALIKANLRFVRDRRLNRQTICNIWTAARENHPDIEVDDLAMWLLNKAREGRSFDTWGGVVNLVRQELCHESEEQTQRSDPPFTKAQLEQHCNWCAAELLKAPVDGHRFELDGIVRELLSTADRSEHYIRNLDEAELRLSSLEDDLVRWLGDVVTPEMLRQSEAEVWQALRPYRDKMSADQIDVLERQYQRRMLFEVFRIPKFSLSHFDPSKMAPRPALPHPHRENQLRIPPGTETPKNYSIAGPA
jgi:hypothetical protein